MSRKKLQEAIKKYHQQGLDLNLQPRTLKNRKETLGRLEKFLDKQSFNPKTAQEFMRHLKEKGWTPQSLATETKSLKAFGNFLFKNKLTTSHLTEGLVLPKVHKKELRLLAPELIEKIIFAGTKPRTGDNSKHRQIRQDMKAALRFCLRTGLRVSELCDLKGADFRLFDSPANFSLVSKGGNRDTLPIPRDLIGELRARVKNERVFPVTAKGLNQSLQRGARELKITTPVYVHFLRHVYATTLLRSGVSPAVVQRLMRHRSFEVTNRTYSHYLLQDLANATNTQSIVREGLTPLEVFDEVEKAVKATGIKKDKRFRLKVDQTDKKLVVRVERKISHGRAKS